MSVGLEDSPALARSMVELPDLERGSQPVGAIRSPQSHPRQTPRAHYCGEGIMGSGFVVSATSTAVSIYLKYYYLAGPCGLVTAAVGCGIYYARKYRTLRPLAEVDHDLVVVDQSLQRTAARAEEATEHLRRENQELRARAEELERDRGELERTRVQLVEGQRRLEISNGEMARSISEYQTANGLLQKQVQSMRPALEKLQQQLITFREQNNQFQASFKELGVDVEHLGKEDDRLASVLGKLDAEFDQNVENLNHGVAALQQNCAQVFTQLMKYTASIKEEVERLRKSAAQFDAAEQDLSRKLIRLRELEQESERQARELDVTKRELAHVQAGLEQERGAFAAERLKFERTISELSKSQPGWQSLASSMSDSAGRFEQLGQRLEHSFVTIHQAEASIARAAKSSAKKPKKDREAS